MFIDKEDTMGNSICSTCINRNICGKEAMAHCEHYDVVLTRAEVVDLLKTTREKDPGKFQSILNGIKKTYHINLAY